MKKKKRPGPKAKYDWVTIKEAYLADPEMSFSKLHAIFGPSMPMIVKMASQGNWYSERATLIKERFNANRPK